MREGTGEDVLGKGKAVRGVWDDAETLRSRYKIFVIGQWSFVIGHLDER